MMGSKAFADNPVGVDFDPDELVRKLERGVDQRELKKRANIGPRSIDTIPLPPPLVA
jgi:hypothetical protein